MRILVVGGGGREHALVWKLAQSPLAERIYCAPGNAGIARQAQCVPIRPTEIEALAEFAERERIDLTVVGPEAPLIAGIVDLFEARGLRIFGPSADPARIEGSKSFAKRLMKAANIPTAAYQECSSLEQARAYLAEFYDRQPVDPRIVIKADGIAAGKGVVVAENRAQAEEAVTRCMGDRVFGVAGSTTVIEECLVGEECSIMAITDGETIVPLVPSQDHKRVGEGDTGPNTGGMGAYSPVPVVPPDTADLAMERIVRPAVEAIRDLGIPYRGVLYAGIIVTADGPKCIEFNCRLGDPETQVVLPLLQSDLVPLLLGVSNCCLESVEVRWSTGAAAAVVAAAGGYPGDYAQGDVISGLDENAESANTFVFHAGTKFRNDDVVTAGGRVLSVTGIGPDLQTALERAYRGIAPIHFQGMHYRKDIGARALRK